MKKKSKEIQGTLWELITCVKQDQPALHEKSAACTIPQALESLCQTKMKKDIWNPKFYVIFYYIIHLILTHFFFQPHQELTELTPLSPLQSIVMGIKSSIFNQKFHTKKTFFHNM
jgi:hypothetical protein